MKAPHRGAVGCRSTAQIHLGSLELGVLGSVLWNFGSFECDQISVAAIGDCLKGHVQAINYCLSTKHDTIPSGAYTHQVSVRNSDIIRMPKGPGY